MRYIATATCNKANTNEDIVDKIDIYYGARLILEFKKFSKIFFSVYSIPDTNKVSRVCFMAGTLQ